MRKYKALLLTIVGVSYCVGFWYYQNKFNCLPPKFTNKLQVIRGYIGSIPVAKLNSVKFIFIWNGRKILLNWYGQYPDLKAGDKWVLLVKLKPPHGFFNPGGFNYAEYLEQKQIIATGYVKTSNQNLLLATSWRYPITRIRQHIANMIMHAMGANQFTGLFVALIVGARNKLSQSEWQVFRNTGTSHLVAISGLHIGLISGFIYLILLYVWRDLFECCLRVPAKVIASIAAIAAAIIYGLMAGFSLPTQRAVIMITLYMLMILLRRNVGVWRVFGIAFVMSLMLNPLSVLSSGFWLSFSAVGILLYSFSGRLHNRGFYWKWIRPQVVVTFGLIPILLLFFQQFSLLSLFANLVAIPWFSFIVIPLTFLGSICAFFSLHLGSLVLEIAAKMVQLIWPYLVWLSQQQSFILQYSISSPWVLYQLKKVSW